MSPADNRSPAQLSPMPLAQRRVMVLGAASPLGGAVVHDLVARGVGHILAVDPPGHASSAEGELTLATAAQLTRVEADLTRSRNRRSLLFGPGRDQAIDTVVDLAMHRSIRPTGARVHELNVESTRELLGLAERHPTISAFILKKLSDCAQFCNIQRCPTKISLTKIMLVFYLGIKSGQCVFFLLDSAQRSTHLFFRSVGTQRPADNSTSQSEDAPHEPKKNRIFQKKNNEKRLASSTYKHKTYGISLNKVLN